MPPFNPWRELFELLQIAAHRCSGCIERPPVLGPVPVRVALQFLENQVGMSV